MRVYELIQFLTDYDATQEVIFNVSGFGSSSATAEAEYISIKGCSGDGKVTIDVELV